MNPEATVIIPTYEDWGVLQKCLDCLAQQTIPLNRFEVIVANNNPSAEVPAALQLPPNARVIHVPKPGSYAARNAALHEARAEALFFTDSDCQPDTHWIESGLTTLAGLGPIDRIAGAVELFPKGEAWTGPELYDRTYWLRQDVYFQKGWCATANLVTRRAAFDLVGPFNEEHFSSSDRDWNLRATELGSQLVFGKETLIRHPARENFSVLAKKLRRKIGRQHQNEAIKGKRKRSAVSMLVLRPEDFMKIMHDTRLSEADKMRILWVEYRLSLVAFVEFFRLRYLSGTPTRR
jgi:glycosyltransferase involved in cell wall biosynthesis